jgi:hypothetical protein
MKTALLAAFLLWQAGAANEPPMAQPDAMRYERALHVAATSGQACAVLDGQIFPHAAPSLADLRIFSVRSGSGTAQEIPYAVTLSDAATEETQAARLLNVGTDVSGKKIVFELEMPKRAYTDVKLDLDPAVHDFIATATVEGADELGSHVEITQLGSFTLFDLTAQHLSRDTKLRLEESTFRYLHVEMSVVNAPGAGSGSAARFVPGMVEEAEVPPSREAQIVYTTVGETSAIAAVGRESRAVFELPVRVPVERVSFVVAPGFTGNFSRAVRVTAVSEVEDGGGDTRAALPEIVTGRITRVRTRVAGREIRREELGVPAILGANLQGAAKVEVAVENGDDQPLPIAAVRLEMRQREVCFDAAAAGGAGELALFYGDPGLAGPVYDYERRFAVSAKASVAELGPEMLNASYRAPVGVVRSFGERHRGLLWIGLGGVLFALGAVVLRWPRSVGQ